MVNFRCKVAEIFKPLYNSVTHHYGFEGSTVFIFNTVPTAINQISCLQNQYLMDIEINFKVINLLVWSLQNFPRGSKFGWGRVKWKTMPILGCWILFFELSRGLTFLLWSSQASKLPPPPHRPHKTFHDWRIKPIPGKV